MSDEFDATYTTQSKQTRRTSMPSAGFEPAITPMELLQTYVLDRTAIDVGLFIQQ
jgi:hypothetical protein